MLPAPACVPPGRDECSRVPSLLDIARRGAGGYLAVAARRRLEHHERPELSSLTTSHYVPRAACFRPGPLPRVMAPWETHVVLSQGCRGGPGRRHVVIRNPPRR
jgi:hypothetical protein